MLLVLLLVFAGLRSGFFVGRRLAHQRSGGPQLPRIQVWGESTVAFESRDTRVQNQAYICELFRGFCSLQ